MSLDNDLESDVVDVDVESAGETLPVREIVLDDTLKPVTPRHSPPTRDAFLASVAGAKELSEYEREWMKKKGTPIEPDPVIIRSTVPMDADVHHKGYFGYLAAAYDGHHGVVVDPCHVWFTILSELATHVKANAERYRSLFTASAGKTEITVYGNAEDHIDPQDFLPQLRQLVPVGADLFLPTFSTATQGYDVASAAAFCDTVSPYYNYSMMLCGIPRVRVEGSVADWDQVLFNLGAVSARLDGAWDWAQRITPHIAKVRAAAAGEVDDKFWRDIYHTERCGSGGQVEVKGWFRDFAMEKPRPAYPENYPSHTAKVEVTQLETGRKYAYFAGLFSSKLRGIYLEPTYSDVVERLPD